MSDRNIRTTTVDREKTCPFLLRVFVKPGVHHDLDREFQSPDRLPLCDESQLYAWKDTTLRDICLQLLDSNPTIKSNLPFKFSLKLIFLETPRDLSSGSHDAPPARYKSQDLGSILCRDLARPISAAPNSSLKSLQDVRFVVGDFVDVALISSTSVGLAAPDSGRQSFGIRGAARGFSGGPVSFDNGWGRPPSSARWGSLSDRRSGPPGFEGSQHTDNGRWGHNSVTYSERANGAGHRSNDRYRERGGPKWGNGGSQRRADSRERSPPRRRR